jgi:hypothetical protein
MKVSGVIWRNENTKNGMKMAAIESGNESGK